jgi:hypothetical protein
MNELVERLTVNQPVMLGGPDPSVEELRKRVSDINYMLVMFTETRGGTEVGFPVDWDTSDISAADFGAGTGSVHVEGNLVLNYDPVRCIADIDVATLKGTGRLKLEEKAPAADGEDEEE